MMRASVPYTRPCAESFSPPVIADVHRGPPQNAAAVDQVAWLRAVARPEWLRDPDRVTPDMERL